MRTLRRWLGRGLLLVLILALIAAGYLYFELRKSLPQLDGEIALAGLGADVTVERDALGVPTITASNRVDLARATGFVHGQDRFFQMDLMRRDSAGELSAVFGAGALPRDRGRRVHGLRRVAKRMLRDASPARRAELEAYAEGVNAGLTSLETVPFEYSFVRQPPKPWVPEDTGLVILAMWMTLTDEDAKRDLNLTRIYDVLPPAMYEYVTQAGTDLDAAMDGSTYDVFPIPTPDQYNPRARGLALKNKTAGPIPNDEHLAGLMGSNNWAVVNARSKHGGAIVANDMHLSLRVPNIWYRARLVIPGELDATGVTLPGGTPLVAGSTGKIAWGFTNSNVDTADLILIEPKPGQSNEYLTPLGSRTFTERREVIEVANGESVEMLIKDTIFGPVIRADDKSYAIQWAAHQPGAVNLELAQFELVDSVDEAIRLAPSLGMPPQNLAVVDREGNAGWTLIGMTPAPRGDADRRRAMPSSQAPPMRRLNMSSAPKIINPADGDIYTANSRIVSAREYPGLSDGSYALGPRQAQIRDGLRERKQVDEADMLAIQLDHRALFMQRWYDLLVKVVTPAVASRDLRFEKLRGILPSWSGYADADNVAYRWVREFRTSVIDLVMEGLLVEVRERYPHLEFVKMRQLEGITWQILSQRPRHMLNAQFNSYDELLVFAIGHSMDRALRFTPGPVEQRIFGEYNTGSIAHPLANAVHELGPFLNMPLIRLPGDAYMPRVSRKWGGASERFAVSPGKEDQAYFHMPGGQSGHPLSPYYDAGHMAWVNGEATPFLPGAAQHSLRLTAP